MVNKHTAIVLLCYNININLTKSQVPSMNTKPHFCHVL